MLRGERSRHNGLGGAAWTVLGEPGASGYRDRWSGVKVSHMQGKLKPREPQAGGAASWDCLSPNRTTSRDTHEGDGKLQTQEDTPVKNDEESRSPVTRTSVGRAQGLLVQRTNEPMDVQTPTELSVLPPAPEKPRGTCGAPGDLPRRAPASASAPGGRPLCLLNAMPATHVLVCWDPGPRQTPRVTRVAYRGALVSPVSYRRGHRPAAPAVSHVCVTETHQALDTGVRGASLAVSPPGGSPHVTAGEARGAAGRREDTWTPAPDAPDAPLHRHES